LGSAPPFEFAVSILAVTALVLLGAAAGVGGPPRDVLKVLATLAGSLTT